MNQPERGRVISLSAYQETSAIVWAIRSVPRLLRYKRFAFKIEKAKIGDDLHVKVVSDRCPNDC